MRRSTHTPQKLFGLTLTLIGLLSYQILPIPHPETAVRAATRAKAAESAGEAVLGAAANGRIAFVNGSDIYTMNPDGSDRKQLTFGPEFESDPVWSPDGTKIAFARGNSDAGGIFVMNADGSDQRRLTQFKYDQSPTWSPDGTKIAFERTDNSGSRIFVMNADGSDQRAVASGFEEPAWSPDGLKLAVTDFYGIYLINFDGSNQTRITEPTSVLFWPADYDPAWSPDGSKITFTRGDGCFMGCSTEDIWVVNADGSNPTKLAGSAAYTSAWSPDGTKIIFGQTVNCYNSSNYCLSLFVMNPDGSGITNITNTNGKNEWSPSWQPVPLPPSVIDDPQFFVRQQYLDFLSREPDASGLTFWTNDIAVCVADVQCVEAKRINVSAAFFLSIEFQQTGYLVYKTYAAAFGPTRIASTVPLTRSEFLPDVQSVGQGVVVLATGWQEQLEANQAAYFNDFVQRPNFMATYPLTMTSEQYVDSLNANAGGALSASERDQLVNELSSGAKTRAQVLRAVVDDADFTRAHFNRAFVLMQYFGYLRRNPNDAPDNNFDGYNFWLAKLDQFNGNSIDAEMVKAFINSIEYRQRFGP